RYLPPGKRLFRQYGAGAGPHYRTLSLRGVLERLYPGALTQREVLARYRRTQRGYPDPVQRGRAATAPPPEGRAGRRTDLRGLARATAGDTRPNRHAGDGGAATQLGRKPADAGLAVRLLHAQSVRLFGRFGSTHAGGLHLLPPEPNRDQPGHPGCYRVLR